MIISINKIRFILLTIVFIGFNIYSQEINPEDTEVWTPVPAIIEVKNIWQPPSDAIVLFDGSNLNEWQHNDSSDAKWFIEDNSMLVNPGTGNIFTKKEFKDVQLHIEWKTPTIITGDGQNRGNSGIFFQKRYELQILDSYENSTYANGQAASIYKQYSPMVNASKAPGEWQTYDVIFIAPKFDKSGKIISKAEMTVFHNGVLVHNRSIIQGTTVYRGKPSYISHSERQPIMIQDHSNPIAFRNIWVRELN